MFQAEVVGMKQLHPEIEKAYGDWRCVYALTGAVSHYDTYQDRTILSSSARPMANSEMKLFAKDPHHRELQTNTYMTAHDYIAHALFICKFAIRGRAL